MKRDVLVKAIRETRWFKEIGYKKEKVEGYSLEGLRSCLEHAKKMDAVYLKFEKYKRLGEKK